MSRTTQRSAGALYASVILLGLGAELLVRMPLISWDNAAATWQAVSANTGLFRLGILADTAMVMADIGLAVLFFALLRHVHRDWALAAMVLRLMQAAIIAASLLATVGALNLVTGPSAAPEALLALLEIHSIGYDIGLVFFGANTLITAWLLARSGLVPRWLPPLLSLAGLVYLAGSITRIIAPDLNTLMQPAYAVPVVAEVALAITLLIARRTGTAPA
ncbi:DUF4386 domain-containing protein [Oceanicola sp. D3]|uniref:DUF4386 domain-containing protein n=1 Tax=Oceanicola sp. D3 TaxID=2587163 RepID=UPI00111EBD62|nr:DUF4386 domain-containing protein [Oceanicola sp. D3]QDC10456.1 DUF4386 domain-containing protein [Oceanicola sp. D3]